MLISKTSIKFTLPSTTDFTNLLQLFLIIVILSIAVEPAYSEYDIYHPKYFMMMSEYANDGDYIAPKQDILYHKIINNVRTPIIKSNPVVDKNSRILIKFDRDWIENSIRSSSKANFEADILITAKIISKDESREIEVPGYTEFGKVKKTSTAKISNYWEIKAIFQQLQETYLSYFYKDVSQISSMDIIDIVNNQSKITVLLEKITSPTYQHVLKVLCRNLSLIDKYVDPDLIVDYANCIENKWLQELKQNMQDPSKAIKYYKYIQTNLEFLSDILPDDLYKEGIYSNSDSISLTETQKKISRFEYNIEQDLRGGLRETDIFLSPTGVQPGEKVEITIQNGIGDDVSNRKMIILLEVEDFGWRARFSDSFILMDRDKSPDGTVATKFEFASGTTFGWRLRSRNGFLNLIRPGIGINATFPEFNSDDLDLAVGPVFSLFDNKLQINAGWVLPLDSKPTTYWGFGLSFVNLFNSVTGAEDK